ncbi:MAG: DUF2892 domain-containing protein [Saprospiraceae bacterium]|nr:DUF2892 domain-containing protein [Saprospiraceae bacterium]
MKRNVGSLDRILRLVLGAAMVGGGIYFQSWFGAIGLILIGTALINFCPLYAIVGANTCSVRKA